MAYVNRGQFTDRPPEAWRFHLDVQGDFPTSATAHQARLVDGVDLRPLLADIRQPVLLVSGPEDRVVARGCEEELLHGLGNARLAELAGCGHIPHHTHPEALAEMIRHFLTPPRQSSALGGEGEPLAALQTDAKPQAAPPNPINCPS
jgi:pimeloyl-ACP methyl ester carboxylesterase